MHEVMDGNDRYTTVNETKRATASQHPDECASIGYHQAVFEIGREIDHAQKKEGRKSGNEQKSACKG